MARLRDKAPVDENPYAPPRDDDAPAEPGEGRNFALATRWTRFFGAFIDGIFAYVVVFAVRVVIGLATDKMPSFDEMFGARSIQPGNYLGWAASLVPLVIQASLIARSGQSVGKTLLRTRIVDANGKRAGLVNGFVLRTLPLTVIALIPSVLILTGTPATSLLPVTSVTGLVSLINALMIFGADHRCLHDRIAGTYVAVVKPSYA